MNGFAIIDISLQPFMRLKVCLFVQQGAPISPTFFSYGSPYLLPSLSPTSSLKACGQVINEASSSNFRDLK